jgi:hypothetical protein
VNAHEGTGKAGSFCEPRSTLVRIANLNVDDANSGTMKNARERSEMLVRYVDDAAVGFFFSLTD